MAPCNLIVRLQIQAEQNIMIKKDFWDQIVWWAYFFLLCIFILNKIYNLFLPESPNALYFSILRAFGPLFHVPFMLNLAQVSLNIIHLVPLLLFILRIRWLSVDVWQYLLIFRLLFDICGNVVETKTLIAVYHSGFWIFLLVLVQSIATYIPSYVACYLYAFRQDLVFKEKQIRFNV